jgi:hypothetical protein
VATFRGNPLPQFLDVESYEYGNLAALMATFTAVFLLRPPHS